MAAAARIDGERPPVGGQDKVIATAQQIVKRLAADKTAAEDMLRILSTFDHRFSSINFAGDGGDGDGDGDVEVDEVRVEIEAKLGEADKVISPWDSSNSLLFESSPEEIGEYLRTVDDLISLASQDELELHGDIREKVEILIQMAMSRLEDEFRHLMIRNTFLLDSAGLHCSIRRHSVDENLDEELDASNETESSVDNSGHHHHRESLNFDEYRNTELIRAEAVSDLKEIADRMIRCEYHKELCQVYSGVRREILDESLSSLGVDRMSIDEVQKIEWRLLDDKMRKWVKTLKVVVMVLFSGEYHLCEQILSVSDELREECFVESTKGCVMHLLNFGDAVSIQRRSPEKLFRILDMYEALSQMKPKLDELFAGDSGNYVIKEAGRILEWLGEAAKGTFTEFVNRVQKESSKKPMLGGEIHPLTRYVMNYMTLLVAYSSSLESLLDDDGVAEEVIDCGENKTRLGHQLGLLISYLESKLEEKAKLYDDAALRLIFLMNNRLYVVQKVKGSELGKILGENWVKKHRGQIRQYHNSYLRASLTKPLSFLKDDGLGGSGSGSASSVLKVALKERFKNFNLAFEEIYRSQTTWKVPDPQLRDELRLSTSEKIIPAYRSFLGRFGGQLEGTRHATKYIKYTPEDLESQLMELFEVPSGLSNHPKRKLSS